MDCYDAYNLFCITLLFKNVITDRRLKFCGMKDRTVVAHACQKTKLICGMEGENVVAYGRLPSPARRARGVGYGVV